MKITLLVVGSTDSKPIKDLIEDYFQRLKYYIGFEIKTIQPKRKVKQQDSSALKKMEAEAILSHVAESSYLILLDEKGSSYSSEKFAAFLQKRLNAGGKELIFCIGGAYGFDQSVYQRANTQLALSKLTFTHQMVRLVFVEQLYRAFTILSGEKYHH